MYYNLHLPFTTKCSISALCGESNFCGCPTQSHSITDYKRLRLSPMRKEIEY